MATHFETKGKKKSKLEELFESIENAGAGALGSTPATEVIKEVDEERKRKKKNFLKD